VVSRFAARAVTGPLAFLVAGVTDLLAFAIASLWLRRKPRVSRGRASSG
jgi:hypothetical protein